MLECWKDDSLAARREIQHSLREEVPQPMPWNSLIETRVLERLYVPPVDKIKCQSLDLMAMDPKAVFDRVKITILG